MWESKRVAGAAFVAPWHYQSLVSLAATIANKGARGAAIDAYKRGMILESKKSEKLESMWVQ